MYINILCYYFCFLEMSEVFFFLIYVGLKKKNYKKTKNKTQVSVNLQSIFFVGHLQLVD